MQALQVLLVALLHDRTCLGERVTQHSLQDTGAQTVEWRRLRTAQPCSALLWMPLLLQSIASAAFEGGVDEVCDVYKGVFG